MITCNAVFSSCMTASAVLYIIAKQEESSELTQAEKMIVAYEIFMRLSASAFFIVATIIFCKLWNIYQYSNKNVHRRVMEVIPTSLVSGGMLGILYVGMMYDHHHYRAMIWATFA